MTVTFESVVETLNPDGQGGLLVTFVGKPGHYRAPVRPPDLIISLRRGLVRGEVVRVTYDDRDFSIRDVLPA